MSTKMIHAALIEAQDRNEDYLETCQRAGRTQETEAVRRALERIADALVEVEDIEKAAAALLERPERGKMSSRGGPDAWRLLTAIRDEAAQRKDGV